MTAHTASATNVQPEDIWCPRGGIDKRGELRVDLISLMTGAAHRIVRAHAACRIESHALPKLAA